jgi:membrane carboxypeptidase/penicillin-binding protein
MRVATAQAPNIDFPIPDDVVFAYMDRNTGKLAGPGTPNRVKVAFKAGTVPNSNGDNLLRVGEPGVRGTATGSPNGKFPSVPATDESIKPQTEESETSDFMRQEFQ